MANIETWVIRVVVFLAASIAGVYITTIIEHFNQQQAVTKETRAFGTAKVELQAKIDGYAVYKITFPDRVCYLTAPLYAGRRRDTPPDFMCP